MTKISDTRAQTSVALSTLSTGRCAPSELTSGVADVRKIRMKNRLSSRSNQLAGWSAVAPPLLTSSFDSSRVCVHPS